MSRTKRTPAQRSGTDAAMGERIAFSRLRPDAGRPEICLLPALGEKAIPVILGGDFPVWSPDGTRIALVRRRPAVAAGSAWAMTNSAVAASRGAVAEWNPLTS